MKLLPTYGLTKREYMITLRNLALLIVSLALISFFFVVGAAIIAVFLGIFVVLALYRRYIRPLWTQHSNRSAPSDTGRTHTSATGKVIDASYEVIKDEDDQP